jgi:hypothetical protein
MRSKVGEESITYTPLFALYIIGYSEFVHVICTSSKKGKRQARFTIGNLP